MRWKNPVTHSQTEISLSEFQEKMNRLSKYLKSSDSVDDFVRFMEKEVFEYPMILDGKPIAGSFFDTSRLYVAIKYLLERESVDDCEGFRKSGYEEFLKGPSQNDAWRYLSLLFHGEPFDHDLEIKILKGGSYKIKQYYLENYELKDIRGASMMLEWVEDFVIPRQIEKRYISELILYNGGGNIMCILPSDMMPEFAIELENEAQKYLVSANIAYYLSNVLKLRNLFSDQYKEIMHQIENSLNQRKKLKIINPLTKNSAFMEQGKMVCFNKQISFKDVGQISKDIKCTLCNTRKAKYIIRGGKEEKFACASCLHKHLVGREMRKGLFDKYKEFADRPDIIMPQTISEIASETDKATEMNEHYAIIYGDGNNMGLIIQNFKVVTDIMYFSRKIKQAATKAVFSSLQASDTNHFEIVGLGGDDIFIIVPAKKAYQISLDLINNYNRQFQNNAPENGEPEYASTMSVGFCIAKSKTAVKTVLDIAEEALATAKGVARKSALENNDYGSLDFIVMNSQTINQEEKHLTKNTIRPLHYKTAKDLIELVRSIEAQGKKSALQNIASAFKNAECEEEAMLFFEYQDVRGHGIRLNSISYYTEKSGYLVDQHNEKVDIWNDVLDLIGFTGGNMK